MNFQESVLEELRLYKTVITLSSPTVEWPPPVKISSTPVELQIPIKRCVQFYFDLFSSIKRGQNLYAEIAFLQYYLKSNCVLY